MLIRLVVQRETRESGLRRPIRLNRRKPFGKQPDDTTRRVHPDLEDPRDRRQAEFPPPSIQFWRCRWIDHQAIDQPPHQPLHPAWQAGWIGTGNIGGLLKVRAKDRRRQVNGCRRRTVDLFEHPRGKTERVAHEDGLARPIDLGEAGIVSAHRRCDRSKDQRRAAAAMPEIGLPREAVEVLCRLRPDELKASGLAHAAERLGRHQRDVVTPLPEGAADADKRMHVATRTDWRQEKVGHVRMDRPAPDPGWSPTATG